VFTALWASQNLSPLSFTRPYTSHKQFTRDPCGCAFVVLCAVDPGFHRMKFARNLTWEREPGYLYAACVMCTVLPVQASFPNASVYLVSDKRSSLGLSAYLPAGTVSSPLAIDGAPPPIHVDKLPDLAGTLTPAAGPSVVLGDTAAAAVSSAVRAATLAVYAEAIAFSACDMAVHSLSGFSLFSAHWGLIPATNVRLLPRKYNDLTGRMYSCGPDAYVAKYYSIYRDFVKE
jgi:hypothetical protein